MSENGENNQTMPIPVVLSVNICDTSIRDERTKKVTLVGLFNVIGATTFPCTHDQMHVHVAMTNGHGKYKTEIRFTHRKDGTVIVALVGEVEFKTPLQIIELVTEWRRIQFREPGEYDVEVVFNGKLAASRKFMIVNPTEESSSTSGTE